MSLLRDDSSRETPSWVRVSASEETKPDDTIDEDAGTPTSPVVFIVTLWKRKASMRFRDLARPHSVVIIEFDAESAEYCLAFVP